MKVSIIGLGLIGGSLAKDLKTLGFAQEISGVEKNPEHQKTALELGLVDKIETLKDSVQNADLIVLAIPVNAITDTLTQVLNLVSDKAVVTDMGSTKSDICKSVAQNKNRRNFVPSHPMAGTENSGPLAALSGLFKGKTAVLCDTDQSHEFAVKLVEKMYGTLQMRIILMSSQDHDLHAAYVSHLSHISSFVLANTVLDKEKNHAAIFDMAGGGFESTVRLAKSSPDMWTPIFSQNKNHVSKALADYIEHLQNFKDSIDNNDPKGLSSMMNRANEIRRVLQKASDEMNLQSLREEIDRIDTELISVLGKRMQVVQKIGAIKKRLSLPALQSNRWNDVMQDRLSKAGSSALSSDFVTKFFQLIHDEALKIQNLLLNKKDSEK